MSLDRIIRIIFPFISPKSLMQPPCILSGSFGAFSSCVAFSDFATGKPYSGHRRCYRYHNPFFSPTLSFARTCRGGCTANRSKFIPSFSLSLFLFCFYPKNSHPASTSASFRVEPSERSPKKIRVQTAEMSKDPSSTLRRCRYRRLGVVADQGRRQRDAGVGGVGRRGELRRGLRAVEEGVEASNLQSRAPPFLI